MWLIIIIVIVIAIAIFIFILQCGWLLVDAQWKFTQQLVCVVPSTQLGLIFVWLSKCHAHGFVTGQKKEKRKKRQH